MAKSCYVSKLFLLVLTMILLFQAAPNAASAESPIPIYTQADLAAISQNLSGNYLLMNDITISGDWEPIGSNQSSGFKKNGFTGVFDGNGHVIRNLNFNLTSSAKVGLFSINQGTIKNLGIEDSKISGNIASTGVLIYAGFISAVNYGTIENCYNAGNVSINIDGSDSSMYVGGIAAMQAMESLTANSNNIGNFNVKLSGKNTNLILGGIVGEMTVDNGSKITYSNNTGRITGSAAYVRAAGIAGDYYSFSGIGSKDDARIGYSYNTGAITAVSRNFYHGERAFASGIATRGSVIQSYNIGAIKATTHAGGIIADDGNVSDSYNAGAVLSSYYAGGIAGFFSENGSVSNCYNVGSVYGRFSETSKGIVYGSPGCILINNYYLKTSIEVQADEVTALTGAQMQQQASYKGFDFNGVWTMSPDYKYPFPILRALPSPAADTAADFAGGNGTITNPFKVSTKKQLNNVRYYPNANFVMTNNITFSAADFALGGEFYNNGNGWVPIGKGSKSDVNEDIFAGTFDGNGYTILNLRINDRVLGIGGLFGVNYGVIKNLGVVNGDIQVVNSDENSGATAGGIAGRNELQGRILNSYFTGKVSASFAGGTVPMAGGIAGTNSAVINKCFSSATVISNGHSGGIVGTGYAFKSNTSSCYFSGNIVGDTVGGIVGSLTGGSKVVNSINAGTARGRSVGGIVGIAGLGGTINNTINVGTTKGNTAGAIVGAIVGDLDEASVLNSFYHIKTVKAAGTIKDSTLKAKYLNPQQLKQKASYPAFDFNKTWQLDQGMAYPVLRGLPLARSATIAAPTSSKVLVNSAAQDFDAYTINGNNYFKLRDLAFVLNGTVKQFEVTWDGQKKAINMLSNKPYTVSGGEMTRGDGKTKTAVVTTSIIYIDGKEVKMTAYLIGGNNYFKLRDVMQAFNVGVGWDGASKTITIDTSIGYTP